MVAGAEPQGVGADVLLIGVAFAECHAQTPWSARRWRFVSDGLRSRTAQLWWGSVQQMAHALQGARSVGWQPDAHADTALDGLQALLQAGNAHQVVSSYPQPSLFEPVDPYCESFAKWWRHTKISL